MAGKSFFITGTDTGSGKTLATIMLMRAFKANGQLVYGMKPVASGCMQTSAGLVSDDALQLIDNSSTPLPYAQVNPVALASHCSPNIAAQLEGREISLDQIVDAYQQLNKKDGVVIVEGIGGWRTPIIGVSGMGIIIKQLELPVVLVVGLRLGCISHALLIQEAVKNENIEMAAWIANQVDPNYAYTEQTVACLQDALECNLLGLIPYLDDTRLNKTGSYLNITALL